MTSKKPVELVLPRIKLHGIDIPAVDLCCGAMRWRVWPNHMTQRLVDYQPLSAPQRKKLWDGQPDAVRLELAASLLQPAVRAYLATPGSGVLAQNLRDAVTGFNETHQVFT